MSRKRSSIDAIRRKCQAGNAFDRMLADERKKTAKPKPAEAPRRRAKGRTYYCHQCLQKFGRRKFRESSVCPTCLCELRGPLTARARAQVVSRLARQRGIRRTRGRTRYEEYLASDLWKTIRTRVLQRDGRVCRDCGGRANSVHHLSYAPAVMAGRDDSKLVSLCWPCHEKRHPEKDVKYRKTPASGGPATERQSAGADRIP